MRNTNAITANLSEPNLLKNLVEHLADRRNDIGYCHEKMHPGWNAIEQSSIEAFASGDIIFSDGHMLVRMPFDSSFLFTCIKRKGGEYNLSWVSSLS
ncbi:MAG: hypothetical protein ABUT20_21225 [Bacteroidota bacterium]